ncbi:hypothetical protein LPB140_02360 [Sphingorhabdus lutea]|uniref:Solute-binding protein family 5 domain-containing protein n=2 Tax=Sphingorhabdus lutea TaxID=1913578 RepID=A0A1L3JED3_9SPHN|nr:hypothetical protein LPB140_02360 [Sphingorhabdus lutea]
MRHHISIFITIIAAFMLMSCSANDAPDNRKISDDAPIIRLMDADARGLDPQIMSDLSSVRVAMDQFEGLTRYDENGHVILGLAKKMQVSADGLIWHFTLREGVQFSDGQKIMAAHFARGFARIMDEKSASPHRALFGIIKSVEPQGADQIVIKLYQPFPALPQLLAHPAMAALPFHRIDAVGDKWTQDRPMVGSGPYILSSWQLNQKLSLVINPQYHGSRPKNNGVDWTPSDNKQTAMRRILARQADISGDYPESRQEWLQKNYPQLVRISPYIGSYYFVFNLRKTPFNDARVRRALSMAVNRQWMSEKMLGGNGANISNQPAYGVVPPSLYDGAAYRPYWANWPMEMRRTEARKLLSAAGYGPNNPLSFDIRYNSSSEHRRAAVAMATMWRDIGVDAKNLNSEASLHFDMLRRGDFALARSGWIADYAAPENFLAIHQTTSGSQNYTGYNNPAFVNALEMAVAEGNEKKRMAAMQYAEKIMMDDNIVIPLYFYISRALVQPYIRGYEDNPANIHPSQFIWRTKEAMK